MGGASFSHALGTLMAETIYRSPRVATLHPPPGAGGSQYLLSPRWVHLVPYPVRLPFQDLLPWGGGPFTQIRGAG